MTILFRDYVTQRALAEKTGESVPRKGELVRLQGEDGCREVIDVMWHLSPEDPQMVVLVFLSPPRPDA